MSKLVCIYHARCSDGFAAAVVVGEFFGFDNVDFVEGRYGENMDDFDVTDRDVVLVDFTFKRDVMLDIAAKAKTVLVLDHHLSAQKDLVDLPDNVSTVFDMKRSGAMITYQYYFPTRPVPQIIKHIQDRDIWTWILPESRNVISALFSYEYDMDLWREFIFINDPSDRFYVEGECIERKHHKDIDEFIESSAHRMIICGHDVPAVNVPYHWGSDSANKLFQAAEEKFAVYYYLNGEKLVVGLRSGDEGLDVSEIATFMGGGGHRNASAFSIPLNEVIGNEHVQFEWTKDNEVR